MKPSIRYVVFACAAAVFLVVMLTAADCSSSYEPRPTPPKPTSTATIDDAREYEGLELYWLGESYAGLPLTRVVLRDDPDGTKGASFWYGEPVFCCGDSGTWGPPLGIRLQPYCEYTPADYRATEKSLRSHGHGLEDEITSINTRGAYGYLTRYGKWKQETLVLWTGSTTISLGADQGIEQVARDLIPISADVGAGPADFPPLEDRNC